MIFETNVAGYEIDTQMAEKLKKKQKQKQKQKQKKARAVSTRIDKRMADALAVVPGADRYARLVEEATPEAYEAAAEIARSRIHANSNDVGGYLLLSQVLGLQNKHNDAITWYKKGMSTSKQAAPSSAMLLLLCVVCCV